MQHTQTRPPRNAEVVESDLSGAVTHDLRTPLAVLRASLESLGKSFGPEDERALVLGRALGEVIRLGKHVQALVDYALPRPIRPLHCRTAEIAHCALEGLTPERKARVLVALECSDGRLFVDAPLAARAIGHLVEFGLEETREPVLLCARDGATGTSFSVLHDARPDDLTLPENAESQGGTLALGLVLARRDLERLGATVTTRRTRLGSILSEVRFEKPRAAKERA
jgi:hypothetical protein